MDTRQEIDSVIRELTGVRGDDGQEPVWIYGQCKWTYGDRMDFAVERNLKKRVITLMNGQIRRYREGESAMFLVSIPKPMAAAMNIEAFVLTAEELEEKKRLIDTQNSW